MMRRRNMRVFANAEASRRNPRRGLGGPLARLAKFSWPPPGSVKLRSSSPQSNISYFTTQGHVQCARPVLPGP
ncbi:hypothetical protein [Burkholderia pseudomallei]|uniref:hypothetical protein n=1 Tax=Burkholderia pseudomallei TaxID=28450 RepID=UPI00139248E6|nr:hypothetical protein [Burkholderia pseudomallei]